MSKPVKEMIMRNYREKFAGVSDAVLVDIRGVDSKGTLALRSGLAGKQIRVTVLKNHLAKKVFDGGGLKNLNDLIEGPSALVYGGESVVNVARELVTMVKKNDKLKFKGAVMEGVVFSAKEVERLSQFPTRPEAQSQVIQLILSPAGNVISAATSAGSNIAGVLGAMIEKLEKGEEIKKVA